MAALTYLKDTLLYVRLFNVTSRSTRASKHELTCEEKIRVISLILDVMGCAKSPDKIKYYIKTFKIELRRNFPFIYSFFLSHSTRLFHEIKNNFKFIKFMMKT